MHIVAPPVHITGMSKLQRWIDLLAALLRRHQGATLEELVQDVPAYAKSGSKAALRRMFERDKSELRTFGIPIVTEVDGAGEVTGYRLPREQFYLPYLSLVEANRRRRPPRRGRTDAYGYRSLPELAFEADELDAIVAAASRMQQVGDVNLAELARSATRKLAHDLPVDSARAVAEPVYQAPAEAGDVLATLDQALAGRKRVTISYHTISRGQSSTREVEPHGLFFLGSAWYLAARDGDRVKNFRVSRVQSASVNQQAPGSPDYEIPSSFRLEEHARSRQAWELGDAAAFDAVVEFRGGDGASAAAARLGEAVAGSAAARTFRVRRIDAFARWLLAFAGEATPVSPAELVAAWHDLGTHTLARYR